jgi:hypothetical protein
MTSSNPWNEVYKVAAGKKCNNTQITTLRKPDGSQTEGMGETLQLMLEQFTPEDKETEDTHHHAQAQEPAEADDDKEFTIEETRNVVARMDEKKAPGEDRITGEMYKNTFEIFPKYITTMYNGSPENRSISKDMGRLQK